VSLTLQLRERAFDFLVSQPDQSLVPMELEAVSSLSQSGPTPQTGDLLVPPRQAQGRARQQCRKGHWWQADDS
jgi:hypothetical protein